MAEIDTYLRGRHGRINTCHLQLPEIKFVGRVEYTLCAEDERAG